MTAVNDLYVFEASEPRDGASQTLYGIDVSIVRGALSALVRQADVAVPKGVRGLAAYRGNDLLVLDLARLTGKPSASHVDVLALESDAGLVGIAVARLHGASRITSAKTRWNYVFCFSPLIKAYLDVRDGEFAGQTIHLLDVNALMTRARPVIKHLNCSDSMLAQAA